ncbi:MAG: domain containing protein [Hyphomicrobiales bacterium]|nr:domain containing protein [Hyphomicrobiales bacterium]
MHVASLHRYPVKGLSPEPLTKVELVAGQFFPADRILAFENGPSSFDPERPAYQSKTRFLMLMKNARLAEISSRFDDASHSLILMHGGVERARGDVRTHAGREALERFLQDFCAGETRGAVRMLQAPAGFRFTDSIRSGFVSILNLASVRDLEKRMGGPLDPLRFRANVAIEGWEPWVEEELPGKRLRIGGSELRVLKTIDRCLATHVDPGTGVRDRDVVGALQESFGRITCGVYASVKLGGTVAAGDAVDVQT